MPRRRVLSKCDYCRAIGLDCRETRCEIEYTKYVIMVNALIDWLSGPIDVTLYLDSTISKDSARTAGKELRALKREGKLLDFLVKRVIPYINTGDDSTPQTRESTAP